MNIIPENGLQPVTRFLRSTWGALAVIAAAGAIGWASALWFARLPAVGSLTELDGRVKQVERNQRILVDSLSSTADRLVWVICTSVPPNRRDVLAALRVDCGFDSRDRNTIRGVPLLENNEE